MSNLSVLMELSWIANQCLFGREPMEHNCEIKSYLKLRFPLLVCFVDSGNIKIKSNMFLNTYLEVCDKYSVQIDKAAVLSMVCSTLKSQRDLQNPILCRSYLLFLRQVFTHNKNDRLLFLCLKCLRRTCK